MKKLIFCLLALLLVAGCARLPDGTGENGGTGGAAAQKTYALVVKSLENPYMATMYDGFRSACEALGVLPLLMGPGANGAPSQPKILEGLIDRKVDAIAIAANDMEEVSFMLQKAKSAGIPVVSLDSMVKPEDRVVHIQQASAEIIGRVLVQACAQMMNHAGQFAILTTTDAMPNQATWVSWMRRELSDHPEQYAGMTLVEIVYGLDEPGPSAEAARYLLDTYPDLSVIIAPTVVGMRAAAEAIERAESPVRLTGLGLPSEMEQYITKGICPWMYLWNPSEVGRLAAYAMEAFVTGEVRGGPGEIVAAGSLGDKVLTESEDGGMEIVLGNPKVFDMTNIAVWGELF